MRSRTLLLMSLLSLLVLSACSHSRIVQRGSQTPRHVQPSRATPSAVPGDASHVVRAGETLYGISFRFGLRYQDVAAWNGIHDPYVIRVGQRLRLRPPSRGQLAGSPVRPRMPAQGPGRASRPASAAQSAAPVATRPAPTIPAPSTSSLPSATPGPDLGSQSIAGGPAWQWPAQGQIIGRYVAGDQTRQGINIAGGAGQPVAAAADGVVVYSGAGLVGYGELIIIKHSDEWLSAYAHNRKRLVAEGTRVRGGETIAEMGRTGALREMLHFEIRRNGKPVDPLVFLPRP